MNDTLERGRRPRRARAVVAGWPTHLWVGARLGQPNRAPTAKAMGHPRARAVLVLAALSAVSTPALAATKNWIGGASTWDNANAWLPAGQPANGDQVFI